MSRSARRSCCAIAPSKRSARPSINRARSRAIICWNGMPRARKRTAPACRKCAPRWMPRWFATARSLDAGEEASFQALQARIADYWKLLDPIFHWDAAEKLARSDAFMHEELFPAARHDAGNSRPHRQCQRAGTQQWGRAAERHLRPLSLPAGIDVGPHAGNRRAAGGWPPPGTSCTWRGTPICAIAR